MVTSKTSKTLIFVGCMTLISSMTRLYSSLIISEVSFVKSILKGRHKLKSVLITTITMEMVHDCSYTRIDYDLSYIFMVRSRYLGELGHSFLQTVPFSPVMHKGNRVVQNIVASVLAGFKYRCLNSGCPLLPSIPHLYVAVTFLDQFSDVRPKAILCIVLSIKH